MRERGYQPQTVYLVRTYRIRYVVAFSLLFLFTLLSFSFPRINYADHAHDILIANFTKLSIHTFSHISTSSQDRITTIHEFAR